jgi:hypothetical protein
MKIVNAIETALFLIGASAAVYGIYLVILEL